MARDWRRCCRSKMSDNGMVMKVLEDLWPDILKRLPVKKLLEVRSVCKSWKALVSSQAFIQIHSRHVNMNNNNITTTRLQVDYDDLSFAFHRQDTNMVTPLIHVLQIPSYELTHCSPTILHGGILLLHYENWKKEYVVALWNSAIRKHVVIPWPMTTPHFEFARLEGFGFDPQNNDFKVVRSRMQGYYDIFSVRDGAWRMNRGPVRTSLLGSSTCPLRCCALTGCFLNETLYWFTTPATDNALDDLERNGPYGFLMFDCVREEFRTVDLPEQLLSDVNNVPKPFVLDLGGRSVIAIFVFLPVGPDDICELWTYGSGSWNKLRASDAVAAGAGDIFFDNFMLTPLAAEPNQVYARFKCTPYCIRKFSFVFQETLLLTDMGMPDQ